MSYSHYSNIENLHHPEHWKQVQQETGELKGKPAITPFSCDPITL